MDWHYKDFDKLNEDGLDAHLDKNKGKSILRKVAVDSISNSILGEKETQEVKNNCIYELFSLDDTNNLEINLSKNILKYNLGELNLEIDFKSINQDTQSNSNIQNNSKTENNQESFEDEEEVEEPFCWLPQLNKDYLTFDQNFEEEYLLNNNEFQNNLSQKMSYFFEGINIIYF